MNAKIIGTGSYLPERVLTNFDLEKMVDTTDEWITRRVGIKERHITRDDEFASDMACIAASKAIKNSGLNPEDIDLVLCSTISAEMITPTVSCIVQKKLGLVNSSAMDVNSACTGFVSSIIFIPSPSLSHFNVSESSQMLKFGYAIH